MNFRKQLFVTIVFLFIIHSKPYAQASLIEITDLSTISIDAYSDVQIREAMKKFSDMNIEEEEVYSIVKEKGLPDVEVNKLKSRINNLSHSKLSNEEKKEDVGEEEKRTYDSARIPMELNHRVMKVFGAEYFNKNSILFEPNLRIATPSSYILGPDDKIALNIFGLSEKKYSLRVNEEGEIYIPNVGPMYVSGLTIDQATQKIKSKLATTIYRAINSGQTQVAISLTKIRSIRVTVIGQAGKPGTYTVSSLTTLYNLLYLCGGPGLLGTFRSIEVIRGNTVKRVADLYAFLVDGNVSDNILLEDGDVIRIPYYKNIVSVFGAVKREGAFELSNNETIGTVLRLCGGFTEKSYKSSISVERITDAGKKIIDVFQEQFNSFTMMNGDRINIRQNQDVYINKVSISGSVIRPGSYELTKDLTFKELLEKAGGLAADAFTKNTSIFRYQQNRLPTILNVDMDSVIFFNKKVLLQKDDSISINSLFEFKDSMYVKVEGNVRSEVKLNWRDGMSLQDAILMAGGLSAAGDSNKIEISSRIKNVDISIKNHLESETKLVSLSNNVQLSPYDIINVKSTSGFGSQRTVMIYGEVKFPGKYVLQKSGEKLSDIINRAEGFNASADSSSATIRRISKSNLTIREREALFQRLLNVSSNQLNTDEKLRNEIYKSYTLISANLDKAMSVGNSSDNLILEDGDIINVEKNSNLVKISGDIFYPTIIPYHSRKGIKYYIKQAGNYMPTARKSKVLVIYPNGKAKSVKKLFCFKFYPKVTSRAEIFVPQKNKSNRIKVSPSELAVIVSALGVVANVLISAKIL